MSERTAESEQIGTMRLTMVRSTIGRPKDQETTLRSLGLRKLHQTVEVRDTPSVRGMVAKVRHLLEVEGGE